jgi:hydrogenase maturation factor
VPASGGAFARDAQSIFWQMSVVSDGLVAASVGVRRRGVTSMHDATECGVLDALVEVAQASGVGMLVHKQAIIVQPAIAKICGLFGIDPYTSISEGTLVITCRPHESAAVLRRLRDHGILAGEVGEVTNAASGVRLVEDGRERPLVHPEVDPFWAAFGKAASEAKADALAASV